MQRAAHAALSTMALLVEHFVSMMVPLNSAAIAPIAQIANTDSTFFIFFLCAKNYPVTNDYTPHYALAATRGWRRARCSCKLREELVKEILSPLGFAVS